MDLDGIISTDIGLQWGFGALDPTSQSSNMCNECFKVELDEPDFSLVARFKFFMHAMWGMHRKKQ